MFSPLTIQFLRALSRYIPPVSLLFTPLANYPQCTWLDIVILPSPPSTSGEYYLTVFQHPVVVSLFLPPTSPQLPPALYPWHYSRIPHPQYRGLPQLYHFHRLFLLLPANSIPIPCPQQWRREYGQGQRCCVRSARITVVYIGIESILGFFVGVRKE